MILVVGTVSLTDVPAGPALLCRLQKQLPGAVASKAHYLLANTTV